MRVWPGNPTPRGATFDGKGVNFSVFSRAATRIEVCLFDPADPSRETDRFDLFQGSAHTWHAYAPELGAGTLYGLRVHGVYAPERGQRCNPSKLLVDPYAKATWGEIDWKQPVFAYELGGERGDLSIDQRDSAAGVPKSVVVDDAFDWGADRSPATPWRRTVIYEVHVRGFTMRHPEIPEKLRGTYRGFGHPAAIEHLKGLGVTAVELLPVHEFADDGFLADKQLRNFWGYSTLAYFAPEQRYMRAGGKPGDQVADFKAMVKALHAAGIEVIMDVVYNHTCEGNHLGPTLSLRGIDNASYYWLMPDSRYYLDFTGTGNSLNASNPEAARLIVDSLRYWVSAMHVDGFRFDLASTLGRTGGGAFDRHAPVFQIINQDPILSRVKLIAEPWDCGSGGYQVGNFPEPFREWNGKYRTALRRYWKGDDNLASEIGYRLTGSADLYANDAREPLASVNFVTAHDGFTLHDLVSYNDKHNEANGERDQDGSDDNQSWNHGVEGETQDAGIIALREQQKRNLLATLFLSQGVPMLLGGDEIGRTQGGNNNAYCQDNEISWFDWNLDDRRRSLLDFTRRLIKLRQQHPALQRQQFFAGDFIWESDSKDLAWLRPDGEEMSPQDWQKPWISSLAVALGGDALPAVDERGRHLVDDNLLVLMNAHHEPISFKLPAAEGEQPWLLQFDTADLQRPVDSKTTGSYEVAGRSLAMFRRPLDEETLRQAATAQVRAAKKQAERRRRRAGVLVPLFSLRAQTADDWGVGDIGDLPAFAKWAHDAGFSVVQLLPVQSIFGPDASAYAPGSAFALDRVYLSLDDCEDFVAAGGRDALSAPGKEKLAALAGATRVDWENVRAVKNEAIDLAFARFMRDEWNHNSGRAHQLATFMKENRTWLDDYALFATWHDHFKKSWLDWPPGARDRDPGATADWRDGHKDDILRVKWIQWQLDRQWHEVRRAVAAVGVDIMGDLPFVVGLDSADVWANRGLFCLDRRLGTPPDDGSPEGQDWGLPVYNWPAHQRDDFAWLRQRATRAGQLFSLYRVDHAIGLYRTYYRSTDGHSSGFTPGDEGSQLQLGETLMRIMSRFGEVVAEDLGTVPPFLRPSLERLNVPGYRVLRWERDGEPFRDPASWPAASVATTGTHDTESTAEWYDALEPSVRERLRAVPGLGELDPNKPFDGGVRDRILRVVYNSPSTLSLVPFQDALGTRERINTPGVGGGGNWTYRIGKTIEELAADAQDTARLAKLAEETGRAPVRSK